ncbi:hypothetical protein CGCSCA5_v002026 [Colletotrichum siamense]|nr:hypothetical protein CGCSCA5_v002026 [Colletotrichum siamense]
MENSQMLSSRQGFQGPEEPGVYQLWANARVFRPESQGLSYCPEGNAQHVVYMPEPHASAVGQEYHLDDPIAENRGGFVGEPYLDPDVSVFAAEYESLFGNMITREAKEKILDVVCDKVIYYRAQDSRIFPPTLFYEILLQNEPQRATMTPLAVRCVKWFHTMSPDDADVPIVRLNDLRVRLTTGASADSRIVSQPQNGVSRKGAGKRAKIVAHQNPLVASEMEKMATMSYRELIGGMDDFAELERAYSNHIRKHEEDSVSSDQSWPTSPEKERDYVRQAVSAIFDTSHFSEKTSAIEKRAQIAEISANRGTMDGTETSSKKRKLEDALMARKKAPKLTSAESTLADESSSPANQLRAVLRYDLNDYEAEMMS